MSESQLHIDLKQWSAKQYLKQGIEKKDILFEKAFRKKNIKMGERFRSSIADVYIRNDGGTAIYCQCRISNLWLVDFVDRKLPIVKDYCSNIVMVIPNNLELFDPMTFQMAYTELVKNDVKILIAPYSKEVKNKSKVQIFMSYRALEKLCKLRNKCNPQKPIVDFIEKDLEKLVKKSCNRR